MARRPSPRRARRAAPLALLLLLLLLPLALPLARLSAAPPEYARVKPGATLSFPRDHGAHPDFRTEWWYATGWLTRPDGSDLGFHITFFRTRPAVDPANPSRFAPKQVILAHAALSDPRRGRLLYDQRAAREGFGLAGAATGDTDVSLGAFRLARDPASGRYRATIRARDLELALDLAPTQPPLAQGEAGVSQKGPRPELASHYYSVPHLRVSGEVAIEGRREAVTGSAWLDHEWLDTALDPTSVGWDWLGANLDDGGALMAFRIRGQDGGVVWASGALRDAHGAVRRLGKDEIAFTPLRSWRSPRTGVDYPVSMRLRAGDREWELVPLQQDQELDSRGSTGTVYWEGAVTLRDAAGGRAGRGYLELTGYHRPMRL